MAGAQENINITDSLTPALHKLAAKVQDWSGFWPTARALVYKMEARIFDAQGPGWRQLSPVTLANRRKGPVKQTGPATTPKILVDSGRLRASITGAVRSPDKTYSDAPLEMRFGTNVVYARAHQYGLPERIGHIPAHKATVKKGKSKGTTYNVRAHDRRLPAVPARVLLKFTAWGVAALKKAAGWWLGQDGSPKGAVSSG